MNARDPAAFHPGPVAANAAAPFTLDAQQLIGQIAVQLPGATAVFRRLKLDFCCGGHVSLAQAAAGKGLDADAVVAELAQLQRGEALPLAGASATALIDLILARYHEVHRQQLPELIRMARRVEAVHREHPAVPAGLADALEETHAELLDHMGKEEAVLFPLLRQGGNPFVGMPISVMRAEHTEHGAALERLNALTHDTAPPEDACTTWRALYAGIAQFCDDLISHIHLENNVLFPPFEAQAGAAHGLDSGASGCASPRCGCH